MDNNLIQHWFTYHSPTDEQIPKYMEIRKAAKDYAEAANRIVPDCADKEAAFRLLRLVNMAFNQALACYRGPDQDG